MGFFSSAFQEMVQTLKQWGILTQVISTAALIVSFFLFRWVLIQAIRRWNAPTPEEKRRWIVQVKNVSLMILAVGLFGIWATELRAFALSLVAVAAALAIATKEIILCFLGGAYKASVKPYELGDRIEVNGVRGEVIDSNFLSTSLLEIGPGRESNMMSGRQIVIPNSWLLNHPVFNQSIQQEYVLQTLKIPLAPLEDWKKAEEILLEAANRECAAYLEPARWSMMRLGQKEGLDLPKVEPRVTFQIHEHGDVHVVVRFPCLTTRISKTEQAIVRHYLEKRVIPEGEHQRLPRA